MWHRGSEFNSITERQALQELVLASNYLNAQRI
jgi:hypothetical protein